jgi:actin-related protein
LAANTYSGQLDALNIAANNAKETIGKGLVQALTEASAAGDFEGAISNIDKLAGKTVDFIIYVERELQLLAAMPSLVEILTGDVDAFREFGDAFNKVKALDAKRKPQQYGGVYATKYANEAMDSKRKADAAKLAKEKAAEMKLLKEKNAQTLLENKMKKDQAALDELKKRFDVERINLQVALSKATDDETKARIRAQIAILDETGSTAQKAMDELDKAQAAKIAQELAAAQALAKLADGATYAAGVLGKIVFPTPGTPSLTPKQIQDELEKGKFVPIVPGTGGVTGGSANGGRYPSSGFPGADKNPPYMGEPVKPDMFNPDYSKNTGASVMPTATTPNKAGDVYIDNSVHVGEGGTVVDTNTITDIVKTAVQQNNRYGSSLQYAGAIAI